MTAAVAAPPPKKKQEYKPKGYIDEELMKLITRVEKVIFDLDRLELKKNLSK